MDPPRRPTERSSSPFRYASNASAMPASRTSIIGGRSTPRRGSSGGRSSEKSVTLTIGTPSAVLENVALSSSPKRLPPPDTRNRPCEVCEVEDGPTWHCAYCDMLFCNSCWDKQGPHKTGKTGPDGLPHEKADLRIVKRLKNILTPSSDATEQAALHIEDEDTTWFGIDRDAHNQPIFQDYGRYTTIMANSTTGDFKFRYPQLVSFIGQTGAGKSTLVKMLIDQQERQTHLYPRVPFPSPVVGSVRNDNVPTSGDVHLYVDPKSDLTQYPMLYADCEGLDGGENMPMSVQFKANASHHGTRKRADSNVDHRKRPRKRLAKGTQRKIKWQEDSPEKQKREYAVTELYPRLLYTFSDTIVFVLRNPKTFESSVLVKLLNWASASMEKSLNQPTLPHAVIALNATDMEVNPEEWDPVFATRSLMSSVSGAIHRDPKYRALAEYWEGQLGRRIHTTKDLLECFYASVTVVRVPIKGRYMKIDEQITKLHEVITERSAQSFRAKRSSRMLSNSEELNIYLQSAFDHFANDLDTPFNFMDVAFTINPIPLDFGGNILKLAVALRNSHRMRDPRNMFKELSMMVASCILLDCSRQGLKGPANQILDRGYMDYCDNALEDFCAIFWPCTYENKRGRCVNVREGHLKGHQNERGTIIGKGPYRSDFTWETFENDWELYLQENLDNMQSLLNRQMQEKANVPEIDLMSVLHRENVNYFFQKMGGASSFISHSACFCCLREMAQHPLPCGHVICDPCIRAYGYDEKLRITLHTCPLHSNTPFPSPWHIPIKPDLAGLRILSLDGGGIRGIVELEVLRQLEFALGDNIPVQEFFDLIVGTSTGGIISIAIGIENWDIQKCIRMFTMLCDTAFTPKMGGFRIGTTKYKTKPLENILQESFKPEYLFGGSHESSNSFARKVAVTAASETGANAVIFTNYNRPADDSTNHKLERPDDPLNELELWEAARATSAAPTFFRPFVNSRTKKAYLDGALYSNNPVSIAHHESKLLWPDAQEYPPDMLLSIGTGHNGPENPGGGVLTRQESRRFRLRQYMASQEPPFSNRAPTNEAWHSQWSSLLSVFLKRVDNILDSENMWRSFKQELTGSMSYYDVGRFQRLNVRLGFRPPKMDEKKETHRVHDSVRQILGQSRYQMRIIQLARRLFASCFYFDRTAPVRETEDHFDVQGHIRCRFVSGSERIRFMGYWLQKHQLQHFQPFFKIYEVNREPMAQKIVITEQIISSMVSRDHFELDSIVIPVSLETGLVVIQLHVDNDKRYSYPISGFPRTLTAKKEPLKPPSSPTSPSPERSKTVTARQSLRRRRANNRPHQHSPPPPPIPTIPEEMPAPSEPSSSFAPPVPGFFPETPDLVNEWAERRAAANVPPPRQQGPLVMPYIAELEGSMETEIDRDDEDLQRAIERSLLYEEDDFDPEVLARVLEQSKIDQ